MVISGRRRKRILSFFPLRLGLAHRLGRALMLVSTLVIYWRGLSLKLLAMVTLESSKLFAQLPADELEVLARAAQELPFNSGEQIFKEGDPGDGIYVVKSGMVQISALLENGERHVFSQIMPGDIFGEMAVLDNQPRSASASAEKRTTLYFIPRHEMANLLKRSPELSILMLQEISGRLREFNRQYIRKLLQAERMALVGR